MVTLQFTILQNKDKKANHFNKNSRRILIMIHDDPHEVGKNKNAESKSFQEV